MRWMALWQIKPRSDFALLGSGTDQFCTAAPPKDETEGIQQDRFARTRFTRQHIETRLEFELEAINDQHIPDV
jgi:hypothetical protein